VKQLFLVAALVAATAARAPAQERIDPASNMPAETIAYAEADGGAAVQGFAELDIVRLVFAEEFKSFFSPMLEKIPASPAEMTKPVTEWIAGQAAVGLSGVSLRLRKFDGSWERVRITGDKPIDGKLFHRILRSNWTQFPGPSMIVDFEGVAVVEPGPAMKAALDAFLESPPGAFTHKFVQRGARQILQIQFEPFVEEGLWFAPEFHADMTGDRWVIATSAKLLAKATAKERRASLAEDPQFAAARNRHTSGRRVAFAYGNFRRVLEIAKPLLPPAGLDILELDGIASIRAFSFGMSVVEGGVRESYGIALDENPKGFWRLLDALPPGLEMIDKIPPRAAGLVGLKFDLELFMTRFEEVVGDLFPGYEKAVRGAWARAVLAAGIDLDQEVVPAYGDEFAISLFPPAAAGIPVPDFVTVFKLRDTQAFGRLVDKFRVLASQDDIFRVEDYEFKDGGKGWRVTARGMPYLPVYRIHEGKFVGSSNATVMRHMLANWAKPPKSLRNDSEVFKKVMRGLNGGETDSLVALVYGDIRAYLPLLVGFAAGTGVLPKELFKTNPMPDLKKMAQGVSGFALGIRRDKQGIALDIFSPTGTFAVLSGGLMTGRAVGVARAIR
jgi:hypothetical protein